MLGRHSLLFIISVVSRQIKHFSLLINLAPGYEIEKLHLFLYLLILRENDFSAKPSPVKVQHQSLWPSSQAFHTVPAFSHFIMIYNYRHTSPTAPDTKYREIFYTGGLTVVQTLIPATKDRSRSHSTEIKEMWTGSGVQFSLCCLLLYIISNTRPVVSAHKKKILILNLAMSIELL